MLAGTLVSTVFFAVIAAVIVVSAIGMVITRNAMYSALLLVLNFATVALLYLILGAPFISLVQVTVYAGSIMVLFLFVIMLLGAERLSADEPLKGQRALALLLGAVFLAEIGLFLVVRSDLSQVAPLFQSDLGSPAAVGEALFTRYALPFEVTGFLLLVATVGAIMLTRGDEKTPRKETEMNFLLKKRD